MAKLYYKRMKAGLMNMDEVPSLWKKKVQSLLDTDKNRVKEDALC